MIRPLLRQAFSRRRLIKSTYAGQIRKKGTLQQVQKPGFKKYQKMADIQSMFLSRSVSWLQYERTFSVSWHLLFSAFVLDKFPTLSQSSFGAILNSFLGKKANDIHQMEVRWLLSSLIFSWLIVSILVSADFFSFTVCRRESEWEREWLCQWQLLKFLSRDLASFAFQCYLCYIISFNSFYVVMKLYYQVVNIQ